MTSTLAMQNQHPNANPLLLLPTECCSGGHASLCDAAIHDIPSGYRRRPACLTSGSLHLRFRWCSVHATRRACAHAPLTQPHTAFPVIPSSCASSPAVPPLFWKEAGRACVTLTIPAQQRQPKSLVCTSLLQGGATVLSGIGRPSAFTSCSHHKIHSYKRGKGRSHTVEKRMSMFTSEDTYIHPLHPCSHPVHITGYIVTKE